MVGRGLVSLVGAVVVAADGPSQCPRVPNAPVPPKHFYPCSTCSGAGSRPACGSTDCQRCGQQGLNCFNTSGADGCCASNHSGRANCITAKSNGSWTRACCEDGWTKCYGMCCGPAGHGVESACGVSWFGGPCCISRLATLSEQIAAKCCIHGLGVDCQSESQLAPCCYGKESSLVADPHVPCQRGSCEHYQRCAFGVGYNFSQNLPPGGVGKKRCCLLPGGPHPHSECQLDPQGKLYRACNRTGQDCSSDVRPPCCLGEPEARGVVCRDDCQKYWDEQDATKSREHFALICTPVLLCVNIVLYIIAKLAQHYRSLKEMWRALVLNIARQRRAVDANTAEVRRNSGAVALLAGVVSDHGQVLDSNTTQLALNTEATVAACEVMATDVVDIYQKMLVAKQTVVLLPEGFTLELHQPLQFSLRVVLTIGCTNYDHGHWPNLPNGRRSAEKLGETLKAHNFVWLPMYDATKAQMEEGLAQVMRRAQKPAQAQDPFRVLILIYFAGHGTEGPQGLNWHGRDADPEDPKTQLCVREFHTKVVEAAARLSDAGKHFECTGQLGELSIVIVADCCRDKDKAEDPASVAAKVYDGSSKLNFKPSPPAFMTVYTADPGQKAADGEDGSVSPWVEACLKLLPIHGYGSIHGFFGEVAAEVARVTKKPTRRCGLRDNSLPWRVCLLEKSPVPAAVSSGSAGSSTMASSSPSSDSNSASAPAPSPATSTPSGVAGPEDPDVV